MSNSKSISPKSLIGRIEAQQALLGLSNQELCVRAGFENEVALSLIQQGAMKLPLAKVPAFAVALELDVIELFRVALHESDPALATVVEKVFNTMNMTSTEVNLIKHLRELSVNKPCAPIVFSGKTIIALVAA